MLDLSQLRRHTEALTDGDKSSRQEAVRSLKRHEEQDWRTAPPEVVGPLVEALRCQLVARGEGEGPRPFGFPPPFRQDVATVLGNIGPRSAPAVPQLAELLKKGQGEAVREAAALALEKMGKKAGGAVPDLIMVLLSDCKGTLAARAARALGAIGCADDKVRSALLALWLSPGEATKSQATVALCRLGCDAPGLLPYLTGTVIAHRDVALRNAAAEALGWRDPEEPEVVPALAAALNDDEEAVRLLAAAGLRRMHVSQEKALQSCGQQLKDSSCAETALARFGPRALPALLQALGAADATTRAKAARTLSGIGEAAAPAVPALSEALRDGDVDVRLAAAKAVWNITAQTEEVVPALAQLLKRKWPAAPDTAETRRRFLQGVIEALGRIGTPATAALPMLLEKARDENRHIRESAVRAVRQIDPKAATTAGLN
jgi:HEAT repeat protein